MGILGKALAGAAEGGLQSYSNTLQRQVDTEAQAKRDKLLEEKQMRLIELRDKYSQKAQERGWEHQELQQGSGNYLEGKELTKQELSRLSDEDRRGILSTKAFKEGEDTKKLEDVIAKEERAQEDAIERIKAQNKGRGGTSTNQDLQKRKTYYEVFSKELQRLSDKGLKPITPQMEAQAKQQAYSISGLTPENAPTVVNNDDLFSGLGAGSGEETPQKEVGSGEEAPQKEAGLVRPSKKKDEASGPEYSQEKDAEGKWRTYKTEDGAKTEVSEEEAREARKGKVVSAVKEFFTPGEPRRQDYENWEVKRVDTKTGPEFLLPSGRKISVEEYSAYINYIKKNLPPKEYAAIMKQLRGK